MTSNVMPRHWHSLPKLSMKAVVWVWVPSRADTW